MKARTIAACIGVLITAGVNVQAYAGANDFFGGSSGSSSSSSSSNSGPIGGNPDIQQGGAAIVNQGTPAAPPPATPSGDFSSDEKRVQRKYKDNIHLAQKLITKGEAMMKSTSEKDAKKGKILKEIGERRLAELRANNPFPEIAGREPKKVTN